VIRATSRPAASDAHPMESSGSVISCASAARGSEKDFINLARPGGSRSFADSTPVPIMCRACFLGSLLLVGRQVERHAGPPPKPQKNPRHRGGQGVVQGERQEPRRPHGSHLAAVELHHQQFVDFQCHPFAFDAAVDLGGHLGLVELQVGRHVGQAGEGHVGFGQ